MLVSDYNYNLPDERIAKYPPSERGTTRLLVLNRTSGAVTDSYYRDLDQYLDPGDVLILNDTRVMQSRLFCTLPDGRKRELVVLEKHGASRDRVMYRGKLHAGDVLMVSVGCGIAGSRAFRSAAARELAPSARGRLPEEASERRARSSFRSDDEQTTLVDGPDGRGPSPSNPASDSATITITRILDGGIAEVSSVIPLATLAEQYGTVPLPPYLHRDATDFDRERYQTVWAAHTGSAAAPTASLNMTEALLARLKEKGVNIHTLTLHVGLGTFLPIRTDKVEEHHMHSEWYNIPDDTIAAIETAKSTGHRVVAVGTTVARTLEYYAKTGQPTGEDDIFIYPGFEFQLVDALVTNFHAPKSTVLMLAAAFAGWDHLKSAYDYAVKHDYNFLSYGDSMLITDDLRRRVTAAEGAPC